MTPLLPWRPASLSPTEIVRNCATSMCTRLMTPLSSWSPVSRENTLTPMMRPRLPPSMRIEVSFTSFAFSPKMACRRRSSGVSWVSPFGVTLPTRMSPGRTSAPMRMTPSSSRLRSLNSETFGMSWVVTSAPSFVSRTTQTNSSMWIEVNFASLARRSEMTMASSKLAPNHGRNATRTF